MVMQFIITNDVVILRSVHKTEQTQWKGLSSCAYGKREHGFDKSQVRTCRKQIEAMPHLNLAAQTAVTTCQKLFSSRRWNCSSVLNAPKHTPDLNTGTREQAVVHALASGAVTWALSRACAQGTLFLCHCGAVPHEPPNGNFKWGGCGDNVKFGARFAREFLDTSKGNRNKRYIDGEVVVESLATQCKCHGVSGSCNVKTCWRALPNFNEAGSRVYRRYLQGVEVREVNAGLRLHLLPASPAVTRFSRDDLIYITKSPDYCHPMPRLGSIGTIGRQ
ncbi:unnamed protein product, partial [Meganyctiphanes norvegica]